MEKEIWKESEYEGYLISNLGNIKKANGKSVSVSLNSKKGYLQFGLKIGGKRTARKVHRLVATAFIDNPLNKKFVNHKDGDKKNNHWTNLEWVTRSENTKHAWDNGLITARKGSRLVIKKDIEGNIVDKYPSMAAAGRSVGSNHNGVKLACNGDIKVYKGFTWEYGN